MFKYKGFHFFVNHKGRKKEWPYTVELWKDDEMLGTFSFGGTQYDVDKRRIINTLLFQKWPKKDQAQLYKDKHFAIHSIVNAKHSKGIVKRYQEYINLRRIK